MGKKLAASLLFLLLIGAPVAYLTIVVMPLVVQGDKTYHEALEDENLSGRFEKFNRALAFYLEAEKKSPLLFRDWKLSSRTGEVLYALSEYPLASYYYWQAYYDHPSLETRERLERSLRKMKQPDDVKSTSNLPVSYTIIFVWGSFSFFLLALLWGSKRGSLVFGIFLFFSFTYLLALFYFAPLEGIILKRTPFSEEPFKNSDWFLDPGTKVELLDERSGWVKIRTAQGALGYISATDVRVLSAGSN